MTPIIEIHDALYPLALLVGGSVEMNAPAFALLAQKIHAAGKPVQDLTLAELAQMVEDTKDEFNAVPGSALPASSA